VRAGHAGAAEAAGSVEENRQVGHGTVGRSMAPKGGF
jgi:hypothetical protein